MKTKIFAAILFTFLSIGIAHSQTFNRAKLDSLFSILAEKNQAMGSLALSKNGTVIYTKAIGYSYVSDKEKKASTNLTKYRIGSISKMFTATMIFQLVEEGKIKLSNTLDTWFPNIPNAKQITVSNLLNHRSGIHSFTDDPEYKTYMTQPKTHEEMEAIITKGKPDFQPGEKAAYSNSNYVLLGYIVEKVTNKPYSKNLADRITSKIKLSSTDFGGKVNLNENDSYSYKFDGVWKQQPVTDMSIPGGAGSLVSTPADLTKFIEALFSLKLVSQSSLDQMKTITDGFGMGIFQIPFHTKKAYGHNGGIDGFGANLAYFPEDSLAIAYCTNGQVYPMNNILIGILSIYFSKDYLLPSFKTISLKTDELDKYIGLYASSQLPLKITVSKDKETLIAQATGQSAFPLTAFEKDKFKFEQAGVVMEFNPDKNEFVLKQGGGVFTFTKEK